MRKLVSLLTAAFAVVQIGCSSSDVPLAPNGHQAGPLAMGQSQATVAASGAVLQVDGAVLMVPAGSFPLGTVVELEVWSDNNGTYYDVDFNGASGFAPATLGINSWGTGEYELFAASGSSWTLVESSVTGAFERPLSAASSFKTRPVELE